MAYNKAILPFGFISVLWIYLLCPLVSFAVFLEVGPQNQTVVEGDRVTLICDVNNDNDNAIYWTYLIGPGRRRYISNNDYIYPATGYGIDPSNYKVVFDPFQQIYTLVIKSINLSTEAGIYDCGYEYASGRRYTPLGMAVITVSPILESLSCHLNRLRSLGTELNQIFEIACSWTHSQPGDAYFYSSSGESVDVDLRFPNRIISRTESQDSPTLICRYMLDSDTSVTFNTTCIGENTPGLVRVDPFIGEVTVGSSASFSCTSSNENYSPNISWDVSVNGSAPFVSQERLIKNNEVISIINVQDDDQYVLVECKVHISEDVTVSSYASLRIVEVTTHPSPRPSGESQSNRTTDMTERPTNENSVIEITKPVQPNTEGGIRVTLAAVIPLIIIIVVLAITIVLLVRRRNRGSLGGCNGEKSSESPITISSDCHPYSNRIYRSDIRLCSSMSESRRDKPGTRKDSCLKETDLKQEGPRQKPLHLQRQSLDSLLYEKIADELFTSNGSGEKPGCSDCEDVNSANYIDILPEVVDHLPLTEDILKTNNHDNDASLEVFEETFEMNSTMLAERGTERGLTVECSNNEVSTIETIDNSDDPSKLDNRYICHIEDPSFDLTPSSNPTGP